MKRVTTAKREPALPGGYALEQRRRRQGLTRKQTALILLILALVLAAVPLVLWKFVFVKPVIRHEEEPPVTADSSETGGEEPDEPEPAEDYIDYGPGIRPRSGGERKSEDFYTVLILGRDTYGGGNTDTMLLASYDVTNQKAAVMSIPRDTMVNVDWDVKKINSVYNMYGGGERGIRGVYQEVSQLVGFEPDFRVVVEWDAVGKVVDAIGGVWFDNPYPMDYHDPKQNLVIEQEPGYRLITGDDAMQIIRWRQNDNDSPYGYRRKDGGIGDSGRMELQQSFLKAVLRQALTIQNIGNLNKIAKVFEESVETDLTFQNILWFVEKAFMGGLKLDDVEFITMPWTGVMAWSRSYNQKLSYVVPRAQELLDIVNNKLSPFEEVFGMSDLDIMSVTKDGMIRSSTGYVEDRQANSAAASAGSKAANMSAAVTRQPIEETAGVLISVRSTDSGDEDTGGADTGGTPPPEADGDGGTADGVSDSSSGGSTSGNSGSTSGNSGSTSGNSGSGGSTSGNSGSGGHSTSGNSGSGGSASGNSGSGNGGTAEDNGPGIVTENPANQGDADEPAGQGGARTEEPSPAPEPAPAQDPEPAPASEPASASEPTPASEPAPAPEPASAPEPAPAPAPAPAPEPAPAPASSHMYTEEEIPFLPIPIDTQEFSAAGASGEDSPM